MKKTKDPVNQELIDQVEKLGLDKLGVMNSYVWREDPKRLVFTLARYKFVSKIIEGKKNVAEVGCGDGFGSRIVKQTVSNLLITDFDPYFIDTFKELSFDKWPIQSRVHDILKGPIEGQFDAIYSLDVLEHISTLNEDSFIKNIILSLKYSGVLILGMPSLESQSFASSHSKKGHINCKTGLEFKELMGNYFDNVFLFSMNDEVVHTGFSKMAHYLFTVSCGAKKLN